MLHLQNFNEPNTLLPQCAFSGTIGSWYLQSAVTDW